MLPHIYPLFCDFFVLNVYSYALVYYIFRKSAQDIFNSIMLIGDCYLCMNKTRYKGALYNIIHLDMHGRIMYQE
jgi:hypothetical protein